MKKSKIIAAISGLTLAAAATFLIAADHIDSPAAAAAASADIADFYAFESAGNEDNTTFIVTIPDLTGMTEFSENVLIEINIDNNGDLNDITEDLVIQAIPRGGRMFFFGPYAPATTGTSSTIDDSNLIGSIAIDGAGATFENGVTAFAGKRNDAFFFDFNRFNMVRSGEAAGGDEVEGFLPPEEASDFFENLNVNAVVVDVPNSLLGEGTPHPASAINPDAFPQNVYNVWVETKQLQ